MIIIINNTIIILVMIATTIFCWFINVNTVLYDELDVVWNHGDLLLCEEKNVTGLRKKKGKWDFRPREDCFKVQ